MKTSKLIQAKINNLEKLGKQEMMISIKDIKSLLHEINVLEQEPKQQTLARPVQAPIEPVTITLDGSSF